MQKGFAAIKKRLIIAPRAVLQAIKDKLKLESEDWKVTRKGALDRVYRIDAMFDESEEMGKLLGMPECAVTDSEAIETLRGGVKAMEGSGNVTEKMQDMLDSDDGDTPKTWKEFSNMMKKVLETKTVRDQFDGEKPISDRDTSAFNAVVAGSSVVKSETLKAVVKEVLDDRMKAMSLALPHQQPVAFHANSGQQQQYNQQTQSQANGQIGYVPWQGGPQQQQQPTSYYGPPQAFNATTPTLGMGGNPVTYNRPCFDFRRGNCDRGSECRFLHGTNGAGAGGGQTLPQKKKVCYNDGTCTRPNCHFDHPSGKAKPPKERAGTPTPGVGTKRK